MFALGLAVAMTSCAEGAPPRLVLDGSPRFPDVEGVVIAVSREQVTLDGRRTFDLDPKLQSFSTYNLAGTSVFERKGQYVQLGVRGTRAYWMAGIGTVSGGETPSVVYVGSFTGVRRGRAVFKDGTTLRLGRGFRPDIAVATRVSATIDVGQRTVVAMVPA